MDLSVVIVSYNTRELLRGCLGSVLAVLDSRVKHEVIVVDNASTDGSVAMIRDSFPQVCLLANSQNRGFAAGNNQAIQQSSGQYVMLLNPDTLVLKGALESLMALLEERRDAGVVGPKLLFPDGSFQHSAFTFPTLVMIFLDFFPLHYRLLDSRINGRYPRSLYERAEPFPIDHPLGAALMVRRAVIEEVGLLDESFFMYCEEIDWCLRIKKAGWRILCVPRAEIVHHVGQSTRLFRDEMYVELHRSRYRLYHKHYGVGFRRVARWLVALGVWSQGLRARWAAARGHLDRRDLELRMRAYREVRSLS
ncbi:MAG TPA: glycosyltransferase family 2 protein [Anaerolineae bacterium]|nr:glycosyltransferase family 2 protein [Anaerolineae bacterium]